jgi:hypothetical protein
MLDREIVDDPAPKMSAILNETEGLIKIFFSSVRTLKEM